MASTRKCLKAATGISENDNAEFNAYLAEDGATPESAINNVIDDVQKEHLALVSKIEAKGGIVESGKPKQNQEKIEDFGEVLHGAKKHTYTFTKSLEEDIDVKVVPLSKSFPLPNYEKMVADGVDPVLVATIAQIRSGIKRKPARRGLSQWVQDVSEARLQVKALMSGLLKPEDINAHDSMSGQLDIAKLAEDVLPSQIKALSTYTLEKNHFSLYGGEKDVTKWMASKAGKSLFEGKGFDTKQEALDYIKTQVSDTNSKTGKAQTKLDMWTERGKEGIFLGKKVASRKYIELKHFDTRAEAMSYRDAHYDELIELLAKKKKIRAIRRIDNNPRVGVDYRGGKDVTPEMFNDAFGFRGVQFGNWVQGGRRQQDLNNAYDGLMDLAGVLGVPPKALSLNGTLGLAFGARGRGGKNPAAAHYESDGLNINLTKINGAGSLAHELFHAIDNYFGTMDSGKGFLTEETRPKRIHKDGKFQLSSGEDFTVREEMYNAWQNLHQALKNETKLVERSAELDQTRGKDYWSTVREMTARSFERYVIEKLKSKGFESDYLANIVSEKEHNAINEVLGDNQSYPYPLDAEMEAVNKAYDHLFKTMKFKDTEQGAALYAKDSTRSWPGNFPKIYGHTTLAKMKSLPQYVAAKAGDMAAALAVVKQVIKGDRIDLLAEQYPQAELIPIREKEAGGNNKLSLALATTISEQAHLPINSSIIAINKAAHTGKGAVDRLVSRKEFQGDVTSGQEYIIVDDVVTQGGTVNELRHYIENNGGKVVAISSLAFARGGNTIALTEKTKNKILEQFNRVDLERLLYDENITGKIEALTESEGRAIASFKSLDTLRARINEAGLSEVTREVRASRIDRSVTSGVTVSQAEQTLSKDKRLAKAIKLGLLKVVQSAKDIPAVLVDGDIQGAYLEGIAYVVANGNTQDTLASTAFHELVHAALDAKGTKFLDPVARKALFKRLDNQIKLNKNGRDKSLSKAIERTEKAGTSKEARLDEVAAYLVTDHINGITQSNTITKWVKEFIAAIKAAIIKHTGITMGMNIDAELLTAIAKSYADYYTGETHSSGNEAAFDPVFSKKGTNTTWRNEPGTKGLSEEQLTTLGKIGRPPHQPIKERLVEEFNKVKYLWTTKFRQGVLDQYESIKSILGDPRSWMLAQMSGSAGGAVEMSFVAGQPYLHSSGLLQIDTGKKSLADIFEPLKDETQLFLMWVVGNRADGINKRSEEAQKKIDILKKEVSALKAQANELEASTITTEGRADNKALRKEAKRKEREIKKLQKRADVKERLFSKEEIDQLKSLNSNTRADGSVWEGREAAYAEALKGFNEMNNAYIQIGIDTGLIGKEDAAIWKEQGFYVPFYRISDEMANPHGIPSASGMVGQTAYKAMKGADMQLDDLLMNTVMNWEHIATASLKNQASLATLQSAVEAGIATKLKSKYASKKKKDTKDVFVRVNGKEQWYTIDDTPEGKLVLESISSLNYSGLNGSAMKLARKFKRALTYGVTAGPEFKIANLIRDSIHAVAVADMSTNILQNVKQGWIATHKDSETNIQAIAGGGLFGDSGYIHGNDPDAIKLLLAKGVEEMNILDTTSKIKQWWNKYQDFGSRLENINRIANIDQSIDAGKDLLTAHFEGRDHMDFQRSGAYEAVRFITQVTPFLNARLQGLDKMARSLQDPKQRTQMAKVMFTYAAASVLLYLYMKDDKDYKEAEDWERDTYHLIKLPNTDVMVRIPRPFETGFIVNMIERGVEQFVDPSVGAEVFFKRLQFGITQTLSFNLPQIIAPAIDVRSNKSSFTGRAIESQSMQNLSPKNRRKSYTSQTAIGISDTLSAVMPEGSALSPIQIDFLVQGYLGWMGATVLDGIDLLARPMAGAPSRPSMRLQDYPVIGRFVRDAKGRNAKQITELYDNRAFINTRFADIEQYKADGEIAKYKKLMRENRRNIAMRKAYNRASLRMSKLRNQAIRIGKMDISSEAKRDRINRLNRKQIEIAKQTVARFKPKR